MRYFPTSIRPLTIYGWFAAMVVGCFIAVIVGASDPAVAHKNATGIVKERMDKFSQSQRDLKQIIGLMRAEQLADIAPLADGLADWADRMPTYFPVGSDDHPSEAAATIWTDFSGFQAAATVMAGAATSLKIAAGDGDTDAVKAAISAVADSCKSCHRVYRAR